MENFQPWACQQKKGGWVQPDGYLEPSRRNKDSDVWLVCFPLCSPSGIAKQARRIPLVFCTKREKLRRGAFQSLSETSKISPGPCSFWKSLRHPLGLVEPKSVLGVSAAQWPASPRCFGSGIYVLKGHFSRRNAVDTLSCRPFFGKPLLTENNRLIVLKRLFNK